MLAFPEEPHTQGPLRHHRDNDENTPPMEHFPGPHRRQYAYPAYSENVSRPQSSKNLSFTDHMLRRKTPNGLVSDAYDGRLTDRTVQLPAAKHVVLSATPEKRQTYPTHWQGSGHFERGNLGSENVVTSQNNRNLRHASFNEQSTALRGASTTPNQNWRNRPAWDFPGGLDSVLNQELPFHPSQRYYVQGQYGSSVPTVRPLALPAWAASPTASASPEMYGPYWPDGSFNPYRPAPVRDDRFYEQKVNDYVRSSQNPLSVQQTEYIGRQEFDLMNSQQWPNHDNNQIRHFTPKPQRQHDQLSGGTLYEGEPYTSRPSQARNFHSSQLVEHHHSEGSNTNTLWQNSHEPISTNFIPNPASEQYTHRENTIAWAQAVYMQLLTSIQQAQKASQPHIDTSGKQAKRPVIYPRPPRQLTFPFRDGFNPQATRPALPTRQQSYPNQWQMDSDPPRPSTAIFSPSRRPSGQNDVMTNVDSGHRLQSFSDHYNDKYRTIRQPNESTQTFGSTQTNFTSVQKNAISALGRIEALCKASNGDWIDGMLLAGCLAYGLGEYYKAMKWYQTILTRDARHVEAMSNLAATLLALNRREEALGHWSAAVKLRPSYFEAVEHLIGLLCHTHRTRDAVAIIQEVERALRLPWTDGTSSGHDHLSESDSETRSRTSSIASMESMERAHFDYEAEGFSMNDNAENDIRRTGFGSSGFAIPGSENGRILALVHAKGNMLYSLGDNLGAAAAFEDAILIATGRRHQAIKGLIHRILSSYTYGQKYAYGDVSEVDTQQPILLSPEKALLTAKHLFPPTGELPGLSYVSQGLPRKAAVATTSNSLLSLAKIYQDGMSNGSAMAPKAATGTRDILALYYLSLSLQPSPSTANNVGILLASVQSNVQQRIPPDEFIREIPPLPGVVPESGVQLALAYYNYGLHLDKKHAHLYTNLGSLLKDIGQLDSAIRMYEQAVQCDPKFDIALANLANAVKDRGQVADAIAYYRRAVAANPDFAEAVCGLATALNSVCGWHGRGGIYADNGKRDPIHVDEKGEVFEAKLNFGWVKRVIDIVERQLNDGQTWGIGCLSSNVATQLLNELSFVGFTETYLINLQRQGLIKTALQQWSGHKWEGARIVKLVERAIRRIRWHWYQDRYKRRKEYKPQCYTRPSLPSSLTAPNAPTVLPFHTFTAPLSAKQIRQISQRNGLRISVSTLRAPWLPATVYPPPAPPRPHLNVGYVSSDFNNHPLAHLMQSVFGLHDPTRVHAICYATTASDKSIHRQQIEREAPTFHDASAWSVEQLVNQIVKDNVHVLVNLNGYTRGARNEVFAARPAPIHMSFMGFAGTLGAEWSDYILADAISVPPETLSPHRRNVDVEDLLHPSAVGTEDTDNWVYAENLIFTPATFFCCDHKQSAPDAHTRPPAGLTPREYEQRWEEEQARRWRLRRELFPNLTDDAVILGNFNQLYKIDPSTFRLYLRILGRVPNAILWLLRFPDLGEQNLLNFAREWAGPDVAGRVVFTDVAPKGAHITRASVLDLFLDTPECNAHTTAADVLWSGTPVLTWGRWRYKMASRMAGSITGSALPVGGEGDRARGELIVDCGEEYLEQAVKLAGGLGYTTTKNGRGERGNGKGEGRLMELRRMLWEGRWSSRLFDTRRWVRDVERAYWEAWRKWESGEGGDIWL